MSSIAAACRFSARAASQQLRSHGTRRVFSTGHASLAAQNFNMPALSPTMTEGNIATWKIKEGESFVAGDVLLEIETDKAQMDVEAQDDGVLARILQGDGSKAVQVGTRIAVTAEPGDDLSSLEIPAEDSKSSKPETPKEQPTAESAPVPKEERTSTPAPVSSSSGASKSASGKAQKQTYPLYPSVQHLLKQNGFPKEEADKIPATGPNGRLLKGDVLAYLGKINKSAGSEVADRLKKLSHLDLSNIKPMAQKPKPAPEKSASTPEREVVEEVNVEVALPISLEAVTEVQKRVQHSIGVGLPLSTFIARAAELANEDLPRSQTSKPSADALFNAVLGLDKLTEKKFTRGNFVPILERIPSTAFRPSARAAKKTDVLDLLTGKRPSPTRRRRTSDEAAAAEVLSVFSVSVPKGDEKRGRVFLERVKTVLEAEPGRLVV